MSTGDNIAARAAQAMPAYIEVIIRFNVAAGGVDKLTGPMEAPAMMYGILELAREAYDVHRARTLKRQMATLAQGPGIVTPGS